MRQTEMQLSDLCGLYILLDLYEKTYRQPGIRIEELKEHVRKKCVERGMADGIRNARNAGRKKKYSEETDRGIVDGYKQGKSIRKTASETGCSTGYVQKLIYEHRNKKHSSREAEPEKNP